MVANTIEIWWQILCSVAWRREDNGKYFFLNSEQSQQFLSLQLTESTDAGFTEEEASLYVASTMQVFKDYNTKRKLPVWEEKYICGPVLSQTVIMTVLDSCVELHKQANNHVTVYMRLLWFVSSLYMKMTHHKGILIISP